MIPTLALIVALGVVTPAVHKSSKAPNIVLIISDDAGWADFGFQGSTTIPTPNLDRLAKRGVVFSDAYAGSVCSPSRASLVTGQYNARIGYEANIPINDMIIGTSPTVGLNPKQDTMFKRMQRQGYTTGVIGKWHLGLHEDNVQNGILFRAGNRPNHMGVDHFQGLLSGGRSYWVGNTVDAGKLRYQNLNPKGIIQDEVVESEFQGRYVTEVFGDWSVNFISEHAAKKKPFFLYSSFTAPHTPMEAKPSDLEYIDAMGRGLSGKRRKYAAMVLSMDREIGRILQAIKDPNGDGDSSDSIESETLVIFVNDNGGDCCDKDPNGCSNGVLKGGKGSSWEGGFRVPLIVAGAGVKPEVQGTVYNKPVHVVDLLPTMLASSGYKPPQEKQFDGVNLMPYFNGDNPELPHKYLYLRRGFNQQASLRMGKWKLYHSKPVGFKLFDLDTNISEDLSKDQLERQPEIVAEMKQALTAFDVQMMRPTWKAPNETTRFRYRESFKPVSNWSEKKMWSDEQLKTGAATLTPWDGYANTTLVFRPIRQGQFIATNDLTRQSGLPFMINTLRFRKREDPILGDSVGVLRGKPCLLTANLEGDLPVLKLESTSRNHRVRFDIALELQLMSDLVIAGDGTDQFEISGGIKELVPLLNVVKKGQSRIHLKGASQLTGTIEVASGELVVEHERGLGDAKVVVHNGAKLICKAAVSKETRQRISGGGQVSFEAINDD